MYKFLLTTLLVLSFQLVAQAQIATWDAVVTDATQRRCNDGAIDLIPPIGPRHHTYEWRDALGFLIARTEDISGLQPGYYHVSINIGGCYSVVFTYFVGIKDYNLQVSKFFPTDCKASKLSTPNGAVALSWDESIEPELTFSYLRNGLLIDITSDRGRLNLGPGRHTIRATAGTCTWDIIFEMCCCSMDYEPQPLDTKACPHLLDNESFELKIGRIQAPTNQNTANGWIEMLVKSPAANSTIYWEGPNGYTYRGFSPRNLLPGEYCYRYSDDCRILPTVPVCVTLSACDEVELDIRVENEVRSCKNTADGGFTLVPVGEDATIYIHNQDGTRGAEVTNFTFTNMAVGTYNFIVVDKYQCSKTKTVQVQRLQPSPREFPVECEIRYYCRDNQESVDRGTISSSINPSFCFITDYFCDILASVRSVSSFDEVFASELEYDDESRTCSFLYTCPGGEPTRYSGILEVEKNTIDCDDVPIIQNNSSTVDESFKVDIATRVCNIRTAVQQVERVTFPRKSTTVTRQGFITCSCIRGGGTILNSTETTYEYKDVDGRTKRFNCCNRTCVSRPELKLVAEADDCQGTVYEAGSGRIVLQVASVQELYTSSFLSANLVSSEKVRLSTGSYILRAACIEPQTFVVQ